MRIEFKFLELVTSSTKNPSVGSLSRFLRVVGEFVLSSDRISDDDIHLILKSSPALRSLVLHVNGPEYLSSSALLDIDKVKDIFCTLVLYILQILSFFLPDKCYNARYSTAPFSIL